EDASEATREIRASAAREVLADVELEVATCGHHCAESDQLWCSTLGLNRELSLERCSVGHLRGVVCVTGLEGDPCFAGLAVGNIATVVGEDVVNVDVDSYRNNLV